MKKNVSASMRTLVGIITPCAWDASDQVAQVSLCATDDEEYVIENSERFLGLAQQAIRVVGRVKTVGKTQRVITIKTFELLDSVALAE